MATAIPCDPDLAELGEVVLSPEKIACRVAELAARISEDYAHSPPVLAAVLQGAWTFACDLVRRLEVPAVPDRIALTRYRRSGGTDRITITRDLSTDISGRHLLLIEDIVDTGLTLRYLVRELERRGPASIAVCSLLDRPGLRLAEIPLRYRGFEVGGEFLVGYGLDFRERYRALPEIRRLSDKAGPA